MKDGKKTVYKDGRYELGSEDGAPYIIIKGEKYALSCHPYEPCLYIKSRSGALTAVHNAFDPECVISAFERGDTVASITGAEYDALDFCKMAEYAAKYADISIDDAEKVFCGRAKKKSPAPEKKVKEKPAYGETGPAVCKGGIIEDEKFNAVVNEYPDSAADHCLVANGYPDTGYNAHRRALVWACRKLFADEDGETMWRYDAGKANGVQIPAETLFAPAERDGKLNYRKAFLYPPYENGYTDADFERLTASLFPNGKDKLEVYEWTTDWSEYFDEGHEWWGTLCYTVYDRSLDRFAVIMASATD